MSDAMAPPSKPLCFVIGPIGKDGSEERRHADFLLLGIIKSVLEADEFGYRVKRSDEDADPGMITDRMITDIIHAELVVADLTGLNANAFYELGIRHAALKPVIHIVKAATVLPFDNVTHRAISVDVSDWRNIEATRERLAAAARAIRAPDYKVSNPITQANASFAMRDSADPRDQVIAEMLERLGRVEAWTTRRVDRLKPDRPILVIYPRDVRTLVWNFAAFQSLMHVAIRVYASMHEDMDRDADWYLENPMNGRRYALVAAPSDFTIGEFAGDGAQVVLVKGDLPPIPKAVISSAATP